MGLYNISEQILQKGYSNVVSTSNNFSCNNGISYLFNWFFLPIIIILILLLLLKFSEEIKIKFLLYFSKRGFVRIHYIKENKKLISKLKRLDQYNTFDFKKRKYVLEKMYDFIIGYDKYNFPIFMYDFQFILPLTIDKKSIDYKISESLGIKKGDKDYSDKISQINMKIDSTILKLVYDKKLMSDLYSISGDSDLRKKILYAVGGLILLGFLYYSGYLEKIINYFL